MKKLVFPIMAMLLCMTACKKESNGIVTLEVEPYNSDAKMHLEVDYDNKISGPFLPIATVCSK